MKDEEVVVDVKLTFMSRLRLLKAALYWRREIQLKF